jgi:hypothetical protein
MIGVVADGQMEWFVRTRENGWMNGKNEKTTRL